MKNKDKNEKIEYLQRKLQNHIEQSIDRKIQITEKTKA